VTGKNPLIEIAVELERIALQDDYFVSRRLSHSVDFYSGIIFARAVGPTGACYDAPADLALRRVVVATGLLYAAPSDVVRAFRIQPLSELRSASSK
jgi:Citrate synthase, C-terminal domain